MKGQLITALLYFIFIIQKFTIKCRTDVFFKLKRINFHYENPEKFSQKVLF